LCRPFRIPFYYSFWMILAFGHFPVGLVAY
jgi:hypothetical protein